MNVNIATQLRWAVWAVLRALGGGKGRHFSVDIITLSLQLSLPCPTSGIR